MRIKASGIYSFLRPIVHPAVHPTNHFKIRPVAYCVGLSLLTVAQISHAQTASSSTRVESIEVRARAAESETNGRIDLDNPSATGSLLGLSPRQTPASVIRINRAEIEQRGALDTQEILRGVPGVTASSPPGSAGTIAYRGFGTTSITQLFNGITVQYDAIAARPINSWIYERVEAIGGPSSFLFGAGAVGGSVNYITKLAERRNFTDAMLRLGQFGRIDVAGGLNAALGSESPRHFARFDINHSRSDGWVDGNTSNATQIAASLLSDLLPNLSHTLAIEHQVENVSRPYWGTPLLNPTVGQGRILPGTEFKNYNSRDALYDQTVTWLRSITEWRPMAGVTVKNTLYGYDAMRNFRNVEVYRFTPANDQVIRSATLLTRHEQRLIGNRIEATLASELLGLPSQWAFALDYSLNRQTRFPTSLPATVSTVNPFNFNTEAFFDIPGMRPQFNPDRENSLRTLAFSIENRTRLTPSLSLLTGLRHDRMSLDLTNLRAVTATLPASFSREYSPTTGRVGLVYDFAPNVQGFAQWATAADPPSGILTTASFADVINNSKLTTGQQAEVGTKFDFWEGRANASVSLYSIKRKNLSTPDANNPGVTLLVGEQSSRGIEVALGARLSPVWTVQANASVLEAQFDAFNQVVSGRSVSRAGNVPTNVPRRIANLWTDYQLTPELQATAALRMVGPVFGDVANTIEGPGYRLIDLGLSYRLSPQLTITGRLRNATDERYAANVTGTPMFFLGAPRSFDLTLRARF